MNSMVRKIFRSFGWASLLVLVATVGCKNPGYDYSEADAAEDTGATMGSDSPAGIQISGTADMLRPGYRIEIGYSGNPSAPGAPHREQIRDDGNIQPPLLGNVMAAGKTIGQLQTELHALYVPAFFKTLTITVRLDERYFFVGGQVRAPGQKLYLSEMTVTKAIQAAGDFTDFANRRKVEIIRNDGTRATVDCKRALRHSEEDLPIYPGDMIHVPRRW
ncbi:MAG: polysaccharide export protein [Verrucomicrobia bacterium]|nr:polysaccharide export protein [Verrucomicrobiota bacterium]